MNHPMLSITKNNVENCASAICLPHIAKEADGKPSASVRL